MKFPPSPPPSGISFGTKPRHIKRRHSSGRLSIRQWQLTSGMVKSWQRLTKVAPIVALSQWNRWSIGSTIVPLFNMCGNMLPTSFGNSLPKKRISAHTSFLACCNVFLINLCAKHSNGSSRIWVFLRSGILWIIWWQQSNMIFNRLQWPVEETRQIVWDALQDYGRIEWKRTLRDSKKVLDVAYHNVLNKFDLTWGSKVLLWPEATWSLLGRIGLRWALFLDFHLGCVASAGLVVFWVSLQLNFQFVSKNF